MFNLLTVENMLTGWKTCGMLREDVVLRQSPDLR